MPRAPFRFERQGERSVRIEHRAADGVKAAVVSLPEGAADFQVALNAGTATLEEVADVFAGAARPHWTTGAAWDHWRIESDAFNCRWPEGFAFGSLPGTKSPLFEWVGPAESRIWIQGPLPAKKLPEPERMLGPGQSVVQVTALTNGPLVELSYQHEGEPWSMFHAVHCPGGTEPAPRGPLRWLKPRRASKAYACIVSAQTPSEHADTVRSAVIEIVESLTPG